MSGKFARRPFSKININDPFFDSLKQDYPGFCQWFSDKAAEGKVALVFEDNLGIGAFINIKDYEVEQIPLQNGMVLPAVPRFKISTMKIDQRYQGQRIGEGALGLTLWSWRDSRVDEIYVTVFDKHKDLISLLLKFGFRCAGYNQNGEGVYIKNRKPLDFSDPCKVFPFINGYNISQTGCLAIDMDYHDTMFAYSDLANTIQDRVDMSVANGLKKVYIGSPTSLAIQAGQPVLIYRKYTGSQGRPGFKSVITSYCIATRVEIIKSNGQIIVPLNNFIAMVGNKSVFPDPTLRIIYNSNQNLTLIELLYVGYFGAGNNVNWDWLNKNGCWLKGHPMSFRYTEQQFRTILREGKIDDSNVIVY